MPARNDYLCEACGAYEEHWANQDNRPSHCGREMVWAPSRPPAVDAYEPFHEFDVAHNGQTFHIDSLKKLRDVENLTGRMARNGDGSPLIWRDYSQNRSNRDVHTLTKDVTKPLDGYAGEDTHPGQIKVDPTVFKPRRGADVAKTHGEVA